MGVRFLMASAACPLVDFAVNLNRDVNRDERESMRASHLPESCLQCGMGTTKGHLTTKNNVKHKLKVFLVFGFVSDSPVHLLIWLSWTQKTKTAPDLIIVLRSESLSRRVMRGMTPCRAAWMRRRALRVVST